MKSTVCYHARRLGIVGDERFARRYDWAEIQRHYDEGYPIRGGARAIATAARGTHVPLSEVAPGLLAELLEERA